MCGPCCGTHHPRRGRYFLTSFIIHIYTEFYYRVLPLMIRRIRITQIAQRVMTQGRRKGKERKAKRQRKKRCAIVFFFNNWLIFACQDPMDLPSNKAITREVGRLREKWQCHSNACRQSHCYVHPEEKTHFAFSHSHFNIWASAIVNSLC